MSYRLLNVISSRREMLRMFRKASNKVSNKVSNKSSNKALNKASRKLSMNMKLWGSYFIIILLLTTLAIVAFKNIYFLGNQLYLMGDKQVSKYKILGDLKDEQTRTRLYVVKHVYLPNEEDKVKIEQAMDSEVAKIRKNIKKLDKTLANGQTKKDLAEFSKNFEAWLATTPTYFKDSRSNNYEIIKPQMAIMTSLGEKANSSLYKVEAGIDKSNNTSIKDSRQHAVISLYQILIVSGVAVLFSIFISFFMTRIIRRSVIGVVNNVESTTNSISEIKKSIDQTAISAQVLDASMNKTNDSVSELVASIQQVSGNTNVTASGVDEISAAVEQMSASISLVANSSDHLASSAEETSSAIQEMMVSVEQVAGNAGNAGASVEQIASAIELMSKSIEGVSKNAVNLNQTAEQTSETVEEMVVSISKVADSAQTVNQLSNSVKNDALEGTASLNETLNGMKEISHVINETTDVMENLGNSSKEIGSIIEVIDDIAEQTNLLALNAAIEAARAGDHGKGFAVVADEVRKLAERSAKATKEIAVLIKGIQNETAIALNSIKDGAQKVSVGNQLAEQTNQAINKISIGIAKVTEEMDQIAHATEEQRKNSEFITKVVENVTKQATEMTYSTKEQSITADEIVIGINNTKNQVQQISMATAEQAKGGRAIVEAVENVTTQASSVTNATREQSLTAEEIVRNIGSIKEMVRQMMIATRDQARYGEEIALEVGNVQKQTAELNNSIETQTNEVDEVVYAINNVNTQIVKLK